MRFNLRTRLLASYILLLTLSLGVIGITLLVLLVNRTEPASTTFQHLGTVALGLNRENLRREFFDRNPDRLFAAQTEVLIDYANAQGIRLVVMDMQSYYGDGVVWYDSAGLFQSGDRINLRLVDFNVQRLTERLDASAISMFGGFTDPAGEEYLFTGLRARTFPAFTVLLADVPSTKTIGTALAEFGSALATPLVQSAVIGLVVAVLMATVISRTIARPLQRVAEAAGYIGRGHYDQAVPLEGPPEVREVAEAFNRMSAEVRDTQQAQRDFMANVSHDLKTPLTSIQGYSQAIIDGTAKDTGRAAEIIYEEAGRLTRMVAELTELARLQAGGIKMRADSVDIGLLISSIIERLKVVAARKNITIYTDTQDGLTVSGDGDRLAQVFTNLLSNALKYTPAEGKIWVSTSLDTHDGQRPGVEIRVRDNGIGIPVDELPRIFERFYQVDKARGPQRGTGLGLAIAREILLAHSGSIRVESRGEGYGTTFIVSLPLSTEPTQHMVVE